MNRPPQEADCRGKQGKGPECRDTKCAFHMHQRFCGGVYTKVLHCELTFSCYLWLDFKHIFPMCQANVTRLALSDFWVREFDILMQTMQFELHHI